MERYDHKKIEAKWRKKWEKEKLYQTGEDKTRPKFYVLDMFPYPSGAGLHVGHPKGYIATDIFARAKMMQGYNVLHPMGWDAFGLPTENYAIQNKIHPRTATEKNIKTFKNQLGKLGFTYDWDREINTTDPEFYKWTQWIFLKMFERGLAYESNEPVNWCPDCKTVLSNEDLENGKCERCGSEIERKPMRQWVLKITDYAERLLNDLEKLPDWEESIKEMQRNWIGRSQGAEVEFEVRSKKLEVRSKLQVFTTRPDTLFGATYFVLSPEHPLVEKITTPEQKKEVEKYINKSAKKSDLERTELQKEKTGVFTGAYAKNPVNQEMIPVWIADYVLMSYGTGAIMAVPAHDERDWEFAKKYNLKITEVVKGGKDVQKETFIGNGVAINSEFIDGLKTEAAKEKMINWLEKNKLGKRAVNYKIKDWVFSRQRYWGEPIPIVHCEKCGKNKSRFLFLHAFQDNSKSVFWPWLKNEIEKHSFEVCVPDLPNSSKPDLNEQMEFILKNYQFDERTIVVTHSLGGVLAMKLLASGKIKSDKLIMVAPPLKTEFKDGEKRPVLEKYCDWKFNYNEIKKNVKDITILVDKNDHLVPREQTSEIGKNLGAKMVEVVAPEPHFNSAESEVILNSVLTWNILNPGVVAVPEKELPLKLPEVKNYEPAGTGESPLANIKEWVNTKCPKCGGPAKRETNTMPQWAGSSWYYLRYIDPHNDKALVDKGKEKYWSPVDFYVGGAEHATRHLIYARFWHKFLYDIGAVNYGEPFTRLQHVGLILAEDGRKMSKRWHNVINPDEIVEKYGADAMRVYEMFMGPFSQPCAWSTNGLIGARRFLDNVYKLKSRIKSELKANKSESERLLHKTIKKVTEDIESFKFNTAISALMIMANKLGGQKNIPLIHYSLFIILLSPFAPHLAEELWSELGNKESIFKQTWPKFNPDLVKDEMINLVIQINGKVRDIIEAPAEVNEAEAKKIALASKKIKKWLEGKEVIKIIFVKGKLVNIVVK